MNYSCIQIFLLSGSLSSSLPEPSLLRIFFLVARKKNQRKRGRERNEPPPTAATTTTTTTAATPAPIEYKVHYYKRVLRDCRVDCLVPCALCLPLSLPPPPSSTDGPLSLSSSSSSPFSLSPAPIYCSSLSHSLSPKKEKSRVKKSPVPLLQFSPPLAFIPPSLGLKDFVGMCACYALPSLFLSLSLSLTDLKSFSMGYACMEAQRSADSACCYTTTYM